MTSTASSLAIEVSSEKALELQLTCESHHKMTFSEFDSFACRAQNNSLKKNISRVKHCWSWRMVSTRTGVNKN